MRRNYVEIPFHDVPDDVITAAFKGMNDALRRLQVEHVVRPKICFFRPERPAETVREDDRRPVLSAPGFGPGRHCSGSPDLRGFVKRADTSERPVLWVSAEQSPDDARYSAAHEAHHHHQLRRGLPATEDAANTFARSVTGYSPAWLLQPAESIHQVVTQPSKAAPNRDDRAEFQRYMVALEAAYKSAPRRKLTPAESAAHVAEVTRRHGEYMDAIRERQRLQDAGYIVPPITAHPVRAVRGGISVTARSVTAEAIRAANRAAVRA